MAAAALALLAPIAAQAAKTLVVCTESSPDGFDIVQYESAVTNDAAGLTIYDQLLAFKPGTTEVVPALVQTWELSEGGTVYTLHLRAGVKFHTTPWFTPTRDFNADDVLWSLDRIRDSGHWAHAIAPRGYVYWEGMGMSKLIRTVEKVDPLTVRITLTKPEAPFLADLAMSAIGSVYSAEYAEQLRRSNQLGRINTEPVGTGPFVFKSYQKDAVIRYTAHTAYWAGAPAIDRLVLAITSDASVRVQRLKTGECLIGTNMNPDTASAFNGDPRIEMVRNNPLYTAYIAPNATRKPTSDPRFREALRLAFDRKTYVQSVYAGNATPADSFIPPAMWSHDPTLADRHDPEQAKALVKASGYDGRELLMLVRIGGSFDGKRAAELVQADWAKVGIKVRVQLTEWGEMLRRTGQGDHDITFMQWASDNGDPDNFFTPNLSCAALQGGSNKARWCNRRFEAAIDDARRISDLPQRTALYKTAQRIVHDDVAVIGTVYPVYLTAVSKRVEGFVPSPFSNNDFRRVRLK